MALGIAREDIERGLAAERARETVPEVEAGAAHAEFRTATDERLELALAARVLNERERRIVFLRFYGDMTERDIADELGISQAQVSRLLAGALAKLREELDGENFAPAGTDISDEAVISRGSSTKQMQSRRQSRRKAASTETGQTRIAAVGASQQKADRPAAGSGRGTVISPADDPQQRDVELPYHVVVKAEAKSGWNAVIEELPGCEAHGSTAEEAVERLRATMEASLSAAMDDRRVIPPPTGRSSKRKPAANPSGRFLVRMPSELHQQLASAAEREQVSLNRYVTETLAASLSASDAAEHEAADTSQGRHGRSFRMLLAANAIVMISAAAAVVALLILALERGI
jgi:predicted HicB family RNase H-like nuclease/DNA-binding CsgD family transcriptional regulator